MDTFPDVYCHINVICTPYYQVLHMVHLKLTGKGRHTSKTSANKLDNTVEQDAKKTTFKKASEIPVNQTEHGKKKIKRIKMLFGSG